MKNWPVCLFQVWERYHANTQLDTSSATCSGHCSLSTHLAHHSTFSPISELCPISPNSLAQVAWEVDAYREYKPPQLVLSRAPLIGGFLGKTEELHLGHTQLFSGVTSDGASGTRNPSAINQGKPSAYPAVLSLHPWSVCSLINCCFALVIWKILLPTYHSNPLGPVERTSLLLGAICSWE